MSGRLYVASLAIAFGLCSCGPAVLRSDGSSAGAALPAAVAPHSDLESAIKHVVIIVQENRSVDDLFQSLPGANVQSWGLDSNGNTVALRPHGLAAPFDPGHSHLAWQTDYANGAMNGWNQEACKGKCPADAAYAYVPRDQEIPYYALARSYAFADDFFETDQGPSFASHQYLVSGTSSVADDSDDKASENPATPTGQLTGGCDSAPGSLVSVINPQGQQPPSLKTYPCFARQSLMSVLDAHGVNWRYYQDTAGAGLWNGVDAIESIWSNRGEMANHVVAPSSQVLTDIADRRLAGVVWVTPSKAASDHPVLTDGSGPSWVAAVVNAIGTSPYWKHTAIFITWDDWGGFYDHVTPTVYNSFELGFRVPLIVVSPYAKRAYVSHVQHEFGSILKFAEQTFDLPSLQTTDRRSDNLLDCFDFTQPPRRFELVPAKLPASYFLSRERRR